MTRANNDDDDEMHETVVKQLQPSVPQLALPGSVALLLTVGGYLQSARAVKSSAIVDGETGLLHRHLASAVAAHRNEIAGGVSAISTVYLFVCWSTRRAVD